MIQRLIQKIVEEHLFKQKVIIIYGPRQSGKTTLSKEILSKQEKKGKKVKYFSADEISVRNAFKDEDSFKLKNAIGNVDLLVLDEAQRIENIGLKLKLLIDNFKDMQIIATGSASFDLANKINEPLTGRFYEFELLPFSIPEILGNDFGSIESLPIIERQMIFGMYPGIYFKDNLTSQKDLENLSNSYLYKDILELENIKKPLVLQKILEMIALQLGSEVNLHEISKIVKVNIRTVENYINLLEKNFVIFRLRAYSRNKRNEISRNFKVYFYDIGVRNALIRNFNDLNLRNDIGGIFENLCILERLKMQNNNFSIKPNRYFWRNYNKNEIDYIEEFSQNLKAFEFKFSKTEISKSSFKDLKELNIDKIQLINKYNLNDFLK